MSAYVGICLGFLASIGVLAVLWGVITIGDIRGRGDCRAEQGTQVVRAGHLPDADCTRDY